MVLLIGRRRDAVDTGGMRELLVLAHQCGGRALRDHEAGVEAGLADEKGWQEADGGIDQSRDTAFRDGAHLGDGERDGVRCKGYRLRVEIAA